MEVFIGMIAQFPYYFAPRDWTFCHGQLLQIKDNQALFSLLGTNYGGDGIHTFGLPDLRPKDENGVPLQIQVGDIYQGKPYMEHSICLYGIYPQRD